MDPEAIINMIANTGFPMVMTVFLIYKIEAKLDTLTAAISSLEEVVRRLS